MTERAALKQAKIDRDLAARIAADFPGWDKPGNEQIRKGYIRMLSSVIHCRYRLSAAIGRPYHAVKSALGERGRSSSAEYL